MSDPGFGLIRKVLTMFQSLSGVPLDFESKRLGGIFRACQSFDAVISISVVNWSFASMMTAKGCVQ